MIVTEAIALLKNSELKQAKIKEDTTAVLGYINLGILELYKRFLLWEAEAVLTIVDGTLLYKLDGVDANVSIDLSDHNLLQIERVYLVPTAANYLLEDEELVINNEADIYSIDTPQFHHLKIHTPVTGQILNTPYINGDTLDITYRASPIF